MAEPLTHQPFMALNANNQATRVHPGVVRRHAKDAPLSSTQFRRITGAEPDRQHVDLKLVSSPRGVALPTDPPAPPEPKAVEPEPVAAKKRKGNKAPWSAARRAKFMATIAEKGLVPRKTGGKKAGKKKRSAKRETGRVEAQIAQHVRPKSNTSRSASELLGAAIEALEELKRRLQALAL